MNILTNLALGHRLAIIDFKLKNERAYLGVMWYVLNSLLLFLILFVAFSKTLGQDINNYPVYVFTGLIMFNFFQQATSESAKSLRIYKSIIKSSKFDNSSLITAIILKTLYCHLFEVLILSVLMLILKISLLGVIAYIPILFFFIIFSFGVSLIISSITALFLDFENIYYFAIRLLWFMSPIFYISEKGTLMHYINLLNPINYFLDSARKAIIYSSFATVSSIIILILSALFLIAGILIFKKLEPKFVERIN